MVAVTTTVVVQASSAEASPAGMVTVTSVTTSSAAAVVTSVVQSATSAAMAPSSMATQAILQPTTTVVASGPSAVSNGAARSTTSSKSTTVGATADGVVGGVVLILAFLLVVWFVLRRRRRRGDGVFSIPTGPINSLGAALHVGSDEAAYAEESKVELPEGVDSAPVSSGGKAEGRMTVRGRGGGASDCVLGGNEGLRMERGWVMDEVDQVDRHGEVGDWSVDLMEVSMRLSIKLRYMIEGRTSLRV
ncbi:hypothetical protein MMC34_004797 [Xylographa carneopallida]|nr:hypothetical protein [Xylographa carneopallida]